MKEIIPFKDYNLHKIMRKGLWLLIVLSAISIGLYPLLYLNFDKSFGILSSKTDELLNNTFWNIGFYTHITLGGIALLTGWAQFSTRFRNRNLKVHRFLGKVYVICALLSATASVAIAFRATGGLFASAGFMSLGIIWFSTTLLAFLYIRNKLTGKHRQMMIYSYAACFAAVTLRIWLPILVVVFDDFIVAYRIVAWLCWIPNMLTAMIIVRLTKEV